MKPCKHLEKVFSMELAYGNKVEIVEFRKWTNINKTIVFKNELYNSKENLSDNHIEYWEKTNYHQQSQNGYVCKECKCTLAFPINKKLPKKR